MTPIGQRRPPKKSRRRTSWAGLILLVVLAVLGVAAVGTARGVLSRGVPISAAPPSVASHATPAPGTVVDVSINKGESAAEIARDLQEKGLVPNDTVFLGFAKLRGGGTDFQPGLHHIPAGASMDDIMRDLEQPVAPKEVKVTFPEGRRLEEQADLAALAGIGTSQEFIQLATHPDPSWTYAFLADHPKGASLEGYLFPDTYSLAASSPKTPDLMKRQLDDFDKRVTSQIRAQIASRKTTLFETLIVASIVEREAKATKERPLIAGVYWNRIKSKQGLFADPTVQYALGKPGSWWPQLSTADLKVNSPYNTYTHGGLPPGPICNPGLASIEAAANPQGDFLYFVAKNDGTGEHAFAKTLAEHNANRAKYGQ